MSKFFLSLFVTILSLVGSITTQPLSINQGLNRAEQNMFPLAAQATGDDCVIPPSGPWPPCATNGNGSSQGSNGAGTPCPASGSWPPGCIPTSGGGNAGTSNQSGAGQPCPASGAWPAGCVPNGGGTTGAGSSAGQPCPASGAWPAGCVPNGSGASSPSADRQRARVTRIVDGDTIVVDINGGLYSVRLIGIDAAEPGNTCAAESAARLSGKVAGQWIELEKDVSDTDQFSRLLRYVYFNNRFINAEMVAEGYAEAKAFPPDTKHSAELEALEQQARQASQGCIWNIPPTPVPTPTPVPQPTSAPPQGNCHPSYPDVCIPPPPPDLDCNEIPYRNFRVTGSDPHRFDGDKDGIGCEQR